MYISLWIFNQALITNAWMAGDKLFSNQFTGHTTQGSMVQTFLFADSGQPVKIIYGANLPMCRFWSAGKTICRLTLLQSRAKSISTTSEFP